MASVFWVGGGVSTNWNSISATQTNWSLTSGGTNLTSTVPTTGDDVIMNGVGASSNGTSVCNASISLRSFDATGFTGTLTQSAAITVTITGDDSVAPGGVAFRLSAGMTAYTPAASATISVVSAGAATTSTLTTGAKTLPNVTINITDAGNVSKVLLGDNLTMQANTSVLTLTDGVLDGNNKNVSFGSLAATGAGTRTITPGSGTWTPTIVTGTVVNFGTNVTISANTGTLDCVAVATGTRTFAMNPTANGNFNNFSISNASLSAQIIQFQTATFTIAGNITYTNVRNIKVLSGVGWICSGTFTWTGPGSSTPGSLSTNGTAGAITVVTASVDWIFIENFTFTGTWTSLNSFSAGLATGAGLTITPPSGGAAGGGRLVSGSLAA